MIHMALPWVRTASRVAVAGTTNRSTCVRPTATTVTTNASTWVFACAAPHNRHAEIDRMCRRVSGVPAKGTGMMDNRDLRIVGWLHGRIVCVVVLAACIAIPLPCCARPAIDSPRLMRLDCTASCRPPIYLARQEAADATGNTAEKDARPDDPNAAAADSKPPPAASESDDLEPFKPSQEIEADQGVDFPYDI